MRLDAPAGITAGAYFLHFTRPVILLLHHGRFGAYASMAMHLDPAGQSLVNQQDNVSQNSTDQRVFPRIKIVKAIRLSVGPENYAGETYDIGQGGLGFIVAETISLGPASVRIANSDYVFDGKILASHKFGAAEALHLHFQFDNPIDKATLAVVLGI